MIDEQCSILKKKFSSSFCDIGKGTCVIVPFQSEKEKHTLLQYGEKNEIPTTICPRDIRMNISAVSFNVKRL